MQAASTLLALRMAHTASDHVGARVAQKNFAFVDYTDDASCEAPPDLAEPPAASRVSDAPKRFTSSATQSPSSTPASSGVPGARIVPRRMLVKTALRRLPGSLFRALDALVGRRRPGQVVSSCAPVTS